MSIAVGNEGLKRINTSTLDEEGKRDQLFEDQLDVHLNFRIHRMELMRYKQRENENTDVLLTDRATRAAYTISARESYVKELSN